MKHKLYATGGHGQTRPPEDPTPGEPDGFAKKPVDPNAPADDQEEKTE